MKISPLLRVACALSSPGTELFWNWENPVTMPLTDSLPNGPASKVAGGCHCSGPVRTNVESGVGVGIMVKQSRVPGHDGNTAFAAFAQFAKNRGTHHVVPDAAGTLKKTAGKAVARTIDHARKG